VPESLVDPVGDGAVVVERSEHLLERGHYVGEAADVEEGLLLAGEGGVGRSSAVALERTATDTLSSPRSALVRLADLGLELFRKGRCLDPATDLRSAALERPDSSASNPFRRASMRATKPSWSRNSRNASAVVANPRGTGSPPAKAGRSFRPGRRFFHRLLDVSHSEPVEIHYVLSRP